MLHQLADVSLNVEEVVRERFESFVLDDYIDEIEESLKLKVDVGVLLIDEREEMLDDALEIDLED